MCKYGNEVVASVSAVGCGLLSYEWKKDEEKITHPEYSGTNSEKLTITCFTSMRQGSHSCIVADSHKSLKSKSANLALGESYRDLQEG